ncbi:prepilin-type N-terminal cleavage/methylation domain-containing protein [Alteromonas ponticola]|uniref:Prepilin-type N-terminal cleavage/methylation domain-containing protein n=1 Tax=Alteromonas aquimaris TaxID=2998417 RepID=A0ABT3P3M6_9ALTE|nr:prepilin-type N-terminal cleavage/methylation domain-containing protein [Alteromonas aquimaris]MCW8107363.1 prepilin-type N-terminal cleavage/methylation domain-containing protein [Alteromonas aquimaris]
MTHSVRQSGVGLIEILITLVILAIGLLGVASLQFVGSFANKDAISRTQSELVAQQVAERLRAAARAATVGDGLVVHNDYFSADTYNFAKLSCSGGSHPYKCFCLSRPADVPNCEDGECNEAEMAEYDGWSLSCSAVQTNPLTVLSVSCNDNKAGDPDVCSAGSRVEIMLQWPVSSSANRQYTLNNRCNPAEGDSFACVFKDITL